jgi:cyanophycin synthetase
MSASLSADPATEIRITTLHATRGINFWSKRPVIRMDLAVGDFENISSADVEHVTSRLLNALPGLRDHECSIGSAGGFVLRLRRGTYAPHIIEHVALELQTAIGHRVGFGRTRGGDTTGEYTVVFEHDHEQVGIRAAALALEIVQRAFAGTLDTVEPALTELEALSKTPDTPPLHQRVFCGVTGGGARAETQQELVRRLEAMGESASLVIDVSPAYLLQAGLPYTYAEMAIILDENPTDVPDRYREIDNARKLLSITADAVRTDGVVICPAKAWELQDYARDQDLRVAIFRTDDDITRRDQRVAMAVARVRDGEIWLERCGDPKSGGPLRDGLPAEAQVAAALAEYVSSNACSD